ncbi:hypothetical protein WJX35_000122 [Escherichia coli]
MHRLSGDYQIPVADGGKMDFCQIGTIHHQRAGFTQQVAVKMQVVIDCPCPRAGGQQQAC